MTPAVIFFAAGEPESASAQATELRDRYPGAQLFVVAELPPVAGTWIPFHRLRSVSDNLAQCRDQLAGATIVAAGLLLEPARPYWGMRALALRLAGNKLHFFPQHAPPFGWSGMPRYLARRARGWWRSQTKSRGDLFVFWWRLQHPSHFRRPLAYLGARCAGAVMGLVKALLPERRLAAQAGTATEGIAVVIPSRDGLSLLRTLLPLVDRDLGGQAAEVIIVDNGSSDGTAEALAREFPHVRCLVSTAPLSFAAAVNRGMAEARFSHICLLNNDMEVEPGFFAALQQPFTRVPGLFCATAQIFFPPGVRREETGKAVMPTRPEGSRSTDFPVRCDLPVSGENESYVLYGSGGCSLYDTGMLRALGGCGEMFRPAYVEDLDLGVRAWQVGWPTVFASGAKVVHHHRSTTGRFYTPEALELVVDVNYLRFLARSIGDATIFRRLWRDAIWILNLKGAQHFPVFHAIAALAFGWRAPRWMARPLRGGLPLAQILAVGSGDTVLFPGRAGGSRPRLLVVTPYLPFPLAHGGAVRMFNLLRAAAGEYAVVLASFADELATPAPELLEICAEIALVRRVGSHIKPDTERPDMVEEFDHPAMHGLIRLLYTKWQPALAQLEFTHMAQYAADCAPAKTLLVEHDITFDLYAQLARTAGSWEARREQRRWEQFERRAWRHVDAVITMSEEDQRTVTNGTSYCVRNGVDTHRFAPRHATPDARRLLFIGAFQHRPNLQALTWFLEEVWPHLAPNGPTLHVIAGNRHEHYLQHYPERDRLRLNQPGIELEGFVSDVRPAYGRAAIVIAPLVASAGTNIKVLEALAMGKAVVSTPAGVNGLDLQDGAEILVRSDPRAMASAIQLLWSDEAARRQIERRARDAAVSRYDWAGIGARQSEVYRRVLGR